VPDDNSPATKQDIHLLKQDVHLVKQDINVVKQDVQLLKQDVQLLKQDVQLLKQDVHQDLIAMEDRLVEKMRDMQTELLRAFAALSEA